MTIVKTIRSLRADYNLTKTRADCKRSTVNSNSDAEITILISFLLFFLEIF